MDDITESSARYWRIRLKQCMEERGLTQLAFVGQLNQQYLTKYHQKDVSRWLNTGNRTASGTIGFPKYETMTMIADFFGVDVGYLTGEIDERTFTMEDACAYTGLNSDSVTAIRQWIMQSASIADSTGTNATHAAEPGDDAGDGTDPLRGYRAATLNRFLSSSRFMELASKLMTLNEMASIWDETPEKFDSLMESLADDSDLPVNLTLELITGAFYGMANESFSALLREAYPTPKHG